MYYEKGLNMLFIPIIYQVFDFGDMTDININMANEG